MTAIRYSSIAVVAFSITLSAGSARAQANAIWVSGPGATDTVTRVALATLRARGLEVRPEATVSTLAESLGLGADASPPDAARLATLAGALGVERLIVVWAGGPNADGLGELRVRAVPEGREHRAPLTDGHIEQTMEELVAATLDESEAAPGSDAFNIVTTVSIPQTSGRGSSKGVGGLASFVRRQELDPPPPPGGWNGGRNSLFGVGVGLTVVGAAGLAAAIVGLTAFDPSEDVAGLLLTTLGFIIGGSFGVSGIILMPGETSGPPETSGARFGATPQLPSRF